MEIQQDIGPHETIRSTTIIKENEKPTQTFVLFGQTGSGKSTLGNTLLGKNVFKESNKILPETIITKSEIGEFEGMKICIFDTPGMNDTNGNDNEHLKQMTNELRNNNNVQAIVILIDYNEVKLDNNLKQLFQVMKEMYPCEKWYKHLIVVWSHFYDYIPTIERENKVPEREEQFKEFFKGYIEPNITEEELENIPQYFIDSIKAREKGTKDRETIKSMIKEISELEPMSGIQDVDRNIRLIEKEEIIKIIDSPRLSYSNNIPIGLYERIKKTTYEGEIYYEDWKFVRYI